METSYIAERSGRFCQIYHSGLKRVIRRLPYSEHNFSALIRAAQILCNEEWEKVTGRKLPVRDNKEELPKSAIQTKLVKGDTTIMEKLPVEFKTEILKKIKTEFDKHALSITYQPTERTLVHMLLPHEDLVTKTTTGKKVVFKGFNGLCVQLSELKKDGDAKLLNDDYYGHLQEGVDAFYNQINFCLGMYGQTQKPVMKWC